MGGLLAVLTGYCIFGGGKRIVKLTSVVVPFMGAAYVLIALIVIFANIKNVPSMFGEIFRDAFDFKAIFGGVAGSCLIFGIKRGLYSNEAGVGSAPNAAAAATVSHPVKQGLVQMLSVYIDTIILCNATVLMCMASGVEPTPEMAGAEWVQTCIASVLGGFGPIFITVAMLLFSFTTLIGNIYYCENGLAYLNGKKMPSKKFMTGFNVFAIAVIFVGAIIPMAAAWDLADITMGGMCFINLIACTLLSKVVVDTYKDYFRQKKEGKDPVFRASAIGLRDDEVDFWK